MEHGGAWPSADNALEIHARLCQDDPVATAELAEAYLDPLANWLHRKHPRLDEHLCGEAAGDAIIALIKNPHAFKPEKGPLDAYLRMSARGDLLNMLQKEKRHSGNRADIENIELLASDWNPATGETDPARIVERDDAARTFFEQVLAPNVTRSFTPAELQVLDLMMQGERKTSAFARVLSISELPDREQRSEVKRVKDRIKRRLQRARGQT